MCTDTVQGGMKIDDWQEHGNDLTVTSGWREVRRDDEGDREEKHKGICKSIENNDKWEYCWLESNEGKQVGWNWN